MAKSEEQLTNELNRKALHKARLYVLETSKRVEAAENELNEAREDYQEALREIMRKEEKAMGIKEE